MRPGNVAALKKRVTLDAVLDRLAQVDTPEGRQRVKDALSREPFPHFEDDMEHPGQLVRIDEDGTRTTGRFVRRKFIPADA